MTFVLLKPNAIFSSRYWILVLICAIGVALRLVSIHESLWIDELHTAWTLSGDGTELADRALLGNNSSLYFALVSIFTSSLGMAEWTLRLLSVLAGSALIPATYAVSRRWSCTVTSALVAALLVAIDRNNIYFSGEARPYAVLQFVSIVHLALFAELLLRQHRTWTWIFWVMTGIVLFHLHCTAALIFAAEVTAYVLLHLLRTEPKMHWAYSMIGFSIIALSMLPAAGLLSQIANRRDNWAMFVSQTRNPLTVFWKIYPLWIYSLAPLLGGAIVLAVRRFRTKSFDAEEDETSTGWWATIVIAVCWLMVPLIVAWLTTELDIARLFHRRYLIASSVSLAPLFAVLWSKYLPRAWWVAIPFVVIAVATISPAKYASYGRGAFAHSAEDWRMPVSIINTSADSVPVILYSGLIEADRWHDSGDEAKRTYCEFPLRAMYPLSSKRAVIALPTSESIALNVAKRQLLSGTAWLLVRGDVQTVARIQSRLQMILGNEWQVAESYNFGRTHLRKFTARQEAGDP